ncbi:hypothetical protein GQ44DRAFT_757468 [Phaeosphaeriaceae sp. PMI808]|nr:hypothetical protein GQ44DRAFT_757468 [Phaeosphaeriaceae sp. PMI808]
MKDARIFITMAAGRRNYTFAPINHLLRPPVVAPQVASSSARTEKVLNFPELSIHIFGDSKTPATNRSMPAVTINKSDKYKQGKDEKLSQTGTQDLPLTTTPTTNVDAKPTLDTTKPDGSTLKTASQDSIHGPIQKPANDTLLRSSLLSSHIFFSHTHTSSDGVYNQNHNTSMATKKQKRNKKSNIQRKKKAASKRALESLVAEATVFINTQIAKLASKACTEASECQLSTNIYILKNLADMAVHTKLLMKDTEEALRAALLNLYMDGIYLDTYGPIVGVTPGYKAAALTDGDYDRAVTVMEGEYNAFADAAFDVAIQTRAAKTFKHTSSRLHVDADFDFSFKNKVGHRSARETYPSFHDQSKSCDTLDGTISMRTPSPPSSFAFDFSMTVKMINGPVDCEVKMSLPPLSFGGTNNNLPATKTKVSADSISLVSTSSAISTFVLNPKAVKEVISPPTILTFSFSMPPTISAAMTGMPTVNNLGFVIRALASDNAIIAAQSIEPKLTMEMITTNLSLVSLRGEDTSEFEDSGESTDDSDGAVEGRQESPTTDDDWIEAKVEERKLATNKKDVTMSIVVIGVMLKYFSYFDSFSTLLMAPIVENMAFTHGASCANESKKHLAQLFSLAQQLQGVSATNTPTQGLLLPPTLAQKGIPEPPEEPNDVIVLYAPVAAAEAMDNSQAAAVRARREHMQNSGHRFNQLIGVKTMRNMIDTLNTPDDRPHHTHPQHTEVEVIEAFLLLSTRERDLIDIGPPHTVQAATLCVNRRLQHRIMIGHISLFEFLKHVHFDENGLASRLNIVEAWEDCSWKDEELEAKDRRDLPLE